MNQLKKVEEQLEGEEQKMLKKKNVKSADVRKMNDEKRCLKMWIEEAGRREKKAALKEMPKLDKKGAEGEAAAAIPKAPPPHVSDGSLPSPYAVLQAALQAMKPDADLDSCPPEPQQPQQDWQLQGSVQPPRQPARLQSSGPVRPPPPPPPRLPPPLLPLPSFWPRRKGSHEPERKVFGSKPAGLKCGTSKFAEPGHPILKSLSEDKYEAPDNGENMLTLEGMDGSDQWNRMEGKVGTPRGVRYFLRTRDKKD